MPLNRAIPEDLRVCAENIREAWEGKRHHYPNIRDVEITEEGIVFSLIGETRDSIIVTWGELEKKRDAALSFLVAASAKA